MEVDLQTVTIAPSKWERRGWMRRIRTYDAYFKTDTYRAKYQDRRARVLTICSGKLRLENLKKATETVYTQFREVGEDTSGQGLFWFTVFAADLEPVQLLTAPIWSVAGSDTPRALLD